MQKIIRTLLKDSIKIRNLSIYNTLGNGVNIPQGILTHRALENDEKNTNLLKSLNLNDDYKSIIENIQQTYKDMDAKMAIRVMDNLRVTLIKDKIFSDTDLKGSKEFAHMCNFIYKDVRSLPMYDIIKALQVLLFFNVSIHSVLINTLLQLIRSSLNDLSVGQIVCIYTLLKKQEHTELIKSILVGLPHVFKEKVKYEFNAESNNLSYILQFSNMLKDRETMYYIFGNLHNNKQLIRPENISDIFYALYNLPELNTVSNKVLSTMMTKIKSNCQSLTFKDITNILYFISEKVAHKKMMFYCDEVVDALCNAVININNHFRENTPILKSLNRMHHVNTTLLDYLSSKVLKDENILKPCRVYNIRHFMYSLVIANYKPPNWENIQILLLEHIESNCDVSIHSIASDTFHLLSLGCYCPKLVEKTFSMYEDIHFIIAHNKTMSTISKLNFCIKTLYPEYTGVMLSKTSLDKIHMYLKKEVYIPLLEILQETVGSVEYIKSGLFTRYGEFIENMVVIQPNGSLMKISHYNVSSLEEMDIPSECSKILFFKYSNKAYSINKRNICSTVLLRIKAIETMKGYYPIVIDPYLWEYSCYNKKVSYLKQSIKSICNNVNIP